jgi:hypothetical protein
MQEEFKGKLEKMKESTNGISKKKKQKRYIVPEIMSEEYNFSSDEVPPVKNMQEE